MLFNTIKAELHGVISLLDSLHVIETDFCLTHLKSGDSIITVLDDTILKKIDNQYKITSIELDTNQVEQLRLSGGWSVTGNRSLCPLL